MYTFARHMLANEDGATGIEYGLLGFNALVSDAGLMPGFTPGAGGSSYTWTFDKDPSASGLTFAVESSTDGVNWGSTGITVLSDTASTFSVSISATLPRLLVRLTVTSS